LGSYHYPNPSRYRKAAGKRLPTGRPPRTEALLSRYMQQSHNPGSWNRRDGTPQKGRKPEGDMPKVNKRRRLFATNNTSKGFRP
jgi:hypothetical protein